MYGTTVSAEEIDRTVRQSSSANKRADLNSILLRFMRPNSSMQRKENFIHSGKNGCVLANVVQATECTEVCSHAVAIGNRI